MNKQQSDAWELLHHDALSGDLKSHDIMKMDRELREIVQSRDEYMDGQERLTRAKNERIL